jgi:hypothetical protein
MLVDVNGAASVRRRRSAEGEVKRENGKSVERRWNVGRPSAVCRQTVGGMSAERRSKETLTV